MEIHSELVAGDGDRDNSSFSIDNEQLVATSGFDFEAGATRSIRVRVTDGEESPLRKSLPFRLKSG